MHFTKLFHSILDSTIWQEPATTKILWITMLAMSDRNGEVQASIPGLAVRAGITLQETERGLTALLSPDAYSRTKDHEGRRIAECEGGYVLLNHSKYRALLSAEERREYNRRKQAEHREKQRTCQIPVSTCQQMSAMSAHTEAEAEAEADKSITDETLVLTDKQPPQTERCADVSALTVKAKLTRQSKSSSQTDAEWLASLAVDSTYKGIDVAQEHGKMTRWCEANGRQATRRRFINWLNRCDRPMITNGTGKQLSTDTDIEQLKRDYGANF